MTAQVERILEELRALAPGRVSSYGRIAARAGCPGASRLVVRVLHSLSEREGLPWHRMLRADGSIALARGEGFELQKALLEAEGVEVSVEGRVDLHRYLA